MFKKLGLGIFLLLIVITGTVQAQNMLYKEIQQAHSKGYLFQEVNLFNQASGNKHEALAKETLLSPDTKAIKNIYETRPQAITVNMKTADGNSYMLELLRSNPFSNNPNIGYIDAVGKHKFNTDKGIHYQGAVMGAVKSIAAISIYANGDVMMLFANEDGNFVTGKLEDNSGKYILYNDRDFLVTPPTTCATEDYTIGEQEDEPIDGGKTTAAYECKKVRLYWELDFELYTNKQSSTLLTTAYATGLFNQVQTLYRNEQIAVELTSIFVWTVDDGYADAKSGDALKDFRDTWNAKGANFDGDLAMLLAKDAGGLGGVAYVDVLCSNSSRYAYGDIHGSYGSLPTYSWDVSMVTHEIGHNLGSKHTHWCGWNTGAGGTCGSIDKCTTQQSGSGCTTCTSTLSNSDPNWKGTIMSYCHLSSRGIDLAEGFGPLPGAKIRSEVSSKSCLKSIISATLTPTDICLNIGKIDLTYDSAYIGTSNFGAANYTYSWTGNGGNTKNITVTQPGTYTVTITDSNGCSEDFSAVVKQDTSAGCTPPTNSIQQIEREYVSIYPNPAHDKVMLKFFNDEADVTTIKLTDITGKVIKSMPANTVSGENNVILNLDNVQPGMYYITLASPNKQFIGLKLVIN